MRQLSEVDFAEQLLKLWEEFMETRSIIGDS